MTLACYCIAFFSPYFGNFSSNGWNEGQKCVFLNASLLAIFVCDIFRHFELYTDKVSAVYNSKLKIRVPASVFILELLGCSSVILLGLGIEKFLFPIWKVPFPCFTKAFPSFSLCHNLHFITPCIILPVKDIETSKGQNALKDLIWIYYCFILKQSDTCLEEIESCFIIHWGF